MLQEWLTSINMIPIAVRITNAFWEMIQWTNLSNLSNEIFPWAAHITFKSCHDHHQTFKYEIWGNVVFEKKIDYIFAVFSRKWDCDQ